jgi:hypothetical protein
VRQDGHDHLALRNVGHNRPPATAWAGHNIHFLARGNVGVAPALGGPCGTTAARSGERGPNTPDRRWSGNRSGGIKLQIWQDGDQE